MSNLTLNVLPMAWPGTDTQTFTPATDLLLQNNAPGTVIQIVQGAFDATAALLAYQGTFLGYRDSMVVVAGTIVHYRCTEGEASKLGRNPQ